MANHVTNRPREPVKSFYDAARLSEFVRTVDESTFYGEVVGSLPGVGGRDRVGGAGARGGGRGARESCRRAREVCGWVRGCAGGRRGRMEAGREAREEASRDAVLGDT